MKTKGFDFGRAFCIFRGSSRRRRQTELFSLQMFDNEGGGGGERNGISGNKGPSSGGSGSLQVPEARIPQGCIRRGSLEKKHLSPHSPASFIIFFLLRRNTLLRVTLKYLPKPEEEEENGGVAGLDVLISPRKTEWGALDSSSQGKQQQRTPNEASPRPAVP